MVEKPLIKFRVHEKQLSHQNILNSLKDLKVVQDEILSIVDEKIKERYLENLRNFRKEKLISKKSKELGLKITSSILPHFLTDKMLVFYLINLLTGNPSITIQNNGNVGIGTTTPAEKLGVAGNIKLSGDIVSDGDICIGTCS